MLSRVLQGVALISERLIMKRTFIFSAATALLFVATSAEAQRGGKDHGDRKDHDDRKDPHGQVSQQEQRRRVDEDRQRQTDYQRRLNAEVRAAQAHSAELRDQRRTAQFEAHEQYLRALQRQQQLQLQRAHDARSYDRDPYYTTAPTYRYRAGSTVRETNQYGVEVLRQAVNQGYKQGYRGGLADRRDGSPANYQRAFAYQDANYGYNGNYIPEDDYNYYFRQGFQRGYDDAYGNRSQYGSVSNGNPSILSNILSGILGLTSIR